MWNSHPIPLRADVKRINEQLGTSFNLRDGRRTFGQRLVDKGVDIESVSKVMGHVNPVITSEVYCNKREDAAIASIKDVYGRA